MTNAPGSNDLEPTVHVVDDDEAVRSSVEFLLQSVGIPCRAHGSAQDFLTAYDPAQRGCLLLDVRMPGMSGLQLHEKLKEGRFRMPVIILTAHSDVPMAVRAMREGAFDLLEKPCNDQVLLDRIQDALAHEAETQQSHAYRDEIETRIARLSPREFEVMRYVVAGYLNKQIADQLGVSIKTVEVHRSRVMDKTKASSLADLVRMAIATDVD